MEEENKQLIVVTNYYHFREIFYALVNGGLLSPLCMFVIFGCVNGEDASK